MTESTLQIEQDARASSRSSVERREHDRADRRLRRLLAVLTLIPAIVGTAILVNELTAWQPTPALVLLGVFLFVPFLVFLTEEF